MWTIPHQPLAQHPPCLHASAELGGNVALGRHAEDVGVEPHEVVVHAARCALGRVMPLQRQRHLLSFTQSPPLGD